jgi:peptidyl-prolyl cis-trans isomerase B (cyclophilin B)
LTVSLLLALMLVLGADDDQARGRRGGGPPPAAPAPVQAPAPAGPTFFVSTLPPDEVQNKQAVLETSAGTIIIDLLPEAAPNHVGHFITKVKEGAYDGTAFHRVISLGIIQGGDPLSKDPAREPQYGTGGLRTLRFEPNMERHTRGAVSAVLIPNDRDSAGSQFFICVSDQPALDGNYTVFGRVAEGLGVAARISQAMTDPRGAPTERIELRRATIRERVPPPPPPFSTESNEELGRYRARLETTLGPIVLEFFPDRAPNHVRNFLRLAESGVFDGTAFHRVVRGFVIQGGFLPSRSQALDERQESFVQTLGPELNDTPHDKGILSMARTADTGIASTSFFIVTARVSALDGQYTVFGRVVEGLDVVERIEAVAVNGETPVTRVEVTKATVTRQP